MAAQDAERERILSDDHRTNHNVSRENQQLENVRSNVDLGIDSGSRGDQAKDAFNVEELRRRNENYLDEEKKQRADMRDGAEIDIDTNRASAEATQRMVDLGATTNGTGNSVLTNNISDGEAGGGRNSAFDKSKGADAGGEQGNN